MLLEILGQSVDKEFACGFDIK